MAIDKLFEDNDCGAPVGVPYIPTTTNKQYYIGDNSNWFLDGKDTGKPSRGVKGDKGDTPDLEPATVLKAGIVKMCEAISAIDELDLEDVSTADATDLPTALLLLNEIKEYINTNIVPLVNSIKSSQNEELSKQTSSGQQGT